MIIIMLWKRIIGNNLINNNDIGIDPQPTKLMNEWTKWCNWWIYGCGIYEFQNTIMNSYIQTNKKWNNLPWIN